MIAPDIRTHMLATYKALRWSMAGVAAVFLLSLALYKAFGHDSDRRDSISAYYHHTNQDLPMQVLFVATFATIGLLLLAYQGYTDRENWALNIAGVALLGVLLFPMDWPVDPAKPESVREKVHISCAFVFFAGITYVCLFRARDTLEHMTDQKWVRTYKRLYFVTGAMMASVPLIWLAFYLAGVNSRVYIVEFCGVYFFHSYWVIKNIELRSAGGVEKKEHIDRMAAEVGTGPRRAAAAG